MAASPAALTASPALIELRKIYKIYGRGEAEVRALDGVDLDIHDGEFMAVMGSSGSGKSTCMNIVGCLDTPTRGSYRFRGILVNDLSRDQLALLRRNYIGFVFQSFNLLPRTSAVDNVELPLIYRGYRRRERRERAMAALERVGLAERASHMPNELSGGQQQRVAIARALVSDPEILLADEPTGNLDSRRSREIIDVLQALNEERGITVIMITHEPDLIRDVVPRVVWFHDGRVQRDGRPRDVLP